MPGGSIEGGTLKIDRLTAAVPAEAVALVLDLYGRLPEVRLTDLLLEVDAEVGFTEAFTHLRTGAPCKDRIGLLNVLLAEGLNLGLSKMARPRTRTTSSNFPACRASMPKVRRWPAPWPW
ncbi:Tn3 family transposase [Alloyangia mangrovi]|uniref:Tn3 family transposase n=1 Tax=Alloyangia mangrovi TaxID=1779329 RepID=UPI0021A7D613|nr:Tn3 family transposase [Alloyangia mangrovi]